MRVFNFSRLCGLAALIAVSACGKKSNVEMPSSHSGADANGGHEGDKLMVPPKGYYDAALQLRLTNLAATGASLADSSAALFLDFDGGTIRHGFGAGESFIVCGDSAHIPSMNLPAAAMDQIVSAVQTYYDKANVRLTVTRHPPTTGDYTTIYVGGSYADLGCSDDASVLGIAPFDAGNVNPADVGFAFAGNGDLTTIAQTIAHESGHTYGLDHTDNEKDIMFANVSEATTGFTVGNRVSNHESQDGPAVLQANINGTAVGAVGGGSTPDPNVRIVFPNLPDDLAALPGLQALAGLAKVIPGIAEGDAVNITALIPQLQRLLPPGVDYAGLDKVVSAIVLAGKAAQNSGQAKGANGLLGIFGKVLANPGTGSAISTVIPMLATLAGFPAGGALGGILGAILGGGTPPTAGSTPAANPAVTSLPDMAALLGVNTSRDPGVLLGTLLNSHARVIASMPASDVRTALETFLKIAYAQAYTAMQIH